MFTNPVKSKMDKAVAGMQAIRELEDEQIYDALDEKVKAWIKCKHQPKSKMDYLQYYAKFKSNPGEFNCEKSGGNKKTRKGGSKKGKGKGKNKRKTSKTSNKC